ncbi:MAG: tRNA pseudouridine(55) synthase TruB [Blastocatellia bacterium]
MTDKPQPKPAGLQPRRLPRPVSPDGVLIVDKEAGMTSHDVVARVRKIMHTRRVGHTGTLDPFATGVLVICLNQATRLAQYLTSDEKEYLATVRFGHATDTGDLTGTPLAAPVDARHLTVEMLEQALEPFRGRQQQTPPMYSAKKIDGVKLYELARQGKEIARQAVEIEIRALELVDSAPRDTGTSREYILRVACSAGTYIRTLAEDIGQALDVGAHLTALRRTRAGDFHLGQAVTLATLAARMEAGTADELIVPMAAALHAPAVTLNEEQLAKVLHGNAILPEVDFPSGALVKLLAADGELAAIAEAIPARHGERRVLQPRAVLREAL